MHLDLDRQLQIYRSTRAFDAVKWAETKCGMLNNYLRKHKLSAVAVNVSGGIDSAVVLRLCLQASKMDGSPIKKVVAVAQPIHSSDWALGRAKELCEKFDQELIIVDQTEIHKQLVEKVDNALGIQGNYFTQGQLRSYLRTPVIYYITQLTTQAGNPCVVMSTGNFDEDGFLLYYAKFGDGACDLAILADLHKSEVFKVGKQLGVPKSILHAPPSADLWENQQDELELGFTYDFIELFAGYYLPLTFSDRVIFENSLSDMAKQELVSLGIKATQIHERNKHKLNPPVNLNIL